MVAKFIEFEEKASVIAIDRKKYPSDKQFTEGEFKDLLEKNFSDFMGCNHSQRIAFLKANGYEVNHANMINAHLPAVPKE